MPPLPGGEEAVTEIKDNPIGVELVLATDGIFKPVLIWAREGSWAVTQMAHATPHHPLDERFISWMGAGASFGLAAPFGPRPLNDRALVSLLSLLQGFTAESLAQAVKAWRARKRTDRSPRIDDIGDLAQ